MNQWHLSAAVSLSLSTAILGTGCTSARDVAVKGEVTASADAASSGPIDVSFYDVTEGDAASASEPLKTIRLEAAGPFDETISAEGDQIRIFALVDADGDGACTNGEAWAESTNDVGDDDTIESAVLSLGTADCPVAQAKE